MRNKKFAMDYATLANSAFASALLPPYKLLPKFFRLVLLRSEAVLDLRISSFESLSNRSFNEGFLSLPGFHNNFCLF